MSAELAQQLSALHPGDHLCLLYDSAAEQLAAVVPFLRDGLARGECCVYIAHNGMADEVARGLAAAGVDTAGARRRGALVLLTTRDTYLRSGRFDPTAMTELLRQMLAQALRAGFSGLRGAGEMTWALGPEIGGGRLLEYEALLNRCFAGNPIRAICQYDRSRFAPEVIQQVLRTHPVAVLGDQVCPNFFYEPPEMALGRMPPAEVVDWKMSLLRRAREADRTLRQSERRYRAIVEDQTELICRWLPDSTLTFVNGAYCRYFGKPGEVLVGKSFLSLLPPEDRALVAREVARLSAGAPVGTWEHRVVLPGGEVRWQQWTNRKLFDDQGRLVELQPELHKTRISRGFPP